MLRWVGRARHTACAAMPNAAHIIAPYAQVADNNTGTFDAYGWLVIIPFFVGTYIFTTGCFLLSVEAINRGDVLGRPFRWVMHDHNTCIAFTG